MSPALILSRGKENSPLKPVQGRIFLKKATLWVPNTTLVLQTMLFICAYVTCEDNTGGFTATLRNKSDETTHNRKTC